MMMRVDKVFKKQKDGLPMAKYSDIVHNINDNAKLLLAEIASGGGSMDELELEGKLFKLYGELGTLSIMEWVSHAKHYKWLTQSGENLKLTNMGWALVEGKSIIEQLERFMGEGELWPDFVDRNSPCVVFHLSSDRYSQDHIEIVLKDVIGNLKSTTRVTGIQTELPQEASWLILFN